MTTTITRTQGLLERFYGSAPAADAPTERQLGFLFDLAGDRAFPRLGGTCGEERIENLAALLENTRPSRRAVSQMIDDLRHAPKDVDDIAEAVTEAPAPVEFVNPGVYEVGDEIFVVKPNREKTRVYAKKLVEINSERLAETGEHVQIEFEYAPGAILKLRPEHRMDVERAKALTIRYGRCIVCGRKLKAAQSVEQGIGPVCIKSFRPREPKPDVEVNRFGDPMHESPCVCGPYDRCEGVRAENAATSGNWRDRFRAYND